MRLSVSMVDVVSHDPLCRPLAHQEAGGHLAQGEQALPLLLHQFLCYQDGILDARDGGNTPEKEAGAVFRPTSFFTVPESVRLDRNPALVSPASSSTIVALVAALLHCPRTSEHRSQPGKRRQKHWFWVTYLTITDWLSFLIHCCFKHQTISEKLWEMWKMKPVFSLPVLDTSCCNISVYFNLLRA